jgi:hypothetical protein
MVNGEWDWFVGAETPASSLINPTARALWNARTISLACGVNGRDPSTMKDVSTQPRNAPEVK